MFQQCIPPDGLIGNLLYFISSHDINVWFAFLGGLLSFFAPCVLPLIPGAIAYVSGVKEDDKNQAKKRILHTISLTLGFVITFILLGFLFSLVLSAINPVYGVWIRRFGALVIIIFSLASIGIISVDFLSRFSPRFIKGKKSLLKSFAFGFLFGLGFSPCATPILGTILGLSITSPVLALPLFAAYAIGLALPFILVTFFGSGFINQITKKSPKIYNIVSIILFYILLFVGVILLFA
jgi:cytochrome c-type biogenesis protein